MRFRLIIVFLFFTVSISAQSPWDLQKCIDHAFEHNIQIKQSQLGMEFSEIQKNQAFGAALPNLNASASHGYNWGQTIDQFTNQFATERIQSNNFGISTGITIFNGFQILNSIKKSQIDLDAAKADFEKMQNDVALNVSNSYLNILFNKEFVKIAQANLQATQNQVDRVRKLVDVGQLPSGNLDEIDAQLATDEASLINAENNLDLAYLVLTQILQIPYEEAEGFEIADPNVSDIEGLSLINDPSVAANMAINNFPEIKSAETNLMSAETDIAIAKGGMSPRLTASYSYGTGYSGANQIPTGESILVSEQIGVVEGTGDAVNSLPFPTFSDSETKAFSDQLADNVNQSLFFSLSIPLFNGFATKSNVERAKLNRLNAEYNLETAKQNLQQEVERSWTNAKAALKNYQAAQRSVVSSEKAFGYAEVRFEQGVINLVDYNLARTRLDNAKAELIRNKYDYLFRVKIIDFYQGKAIILN